MDADFKKRVGLRIRFARERLGLNQRELAQRMVRMGPVDGAGEPELWVDGGTVSRWERGVVYPTQHLSAIANALELDESELMAPDDGSTNVLRMLAERGELLEELRAQVEALTAEVSELRGEVRAVRDGVVTLLAAAAVTPERQPGNGGTGTKGRTGRRAASGPR